MPPTPSPQPFNPQFTTPLPPITNQNTTPVHLYPSGNGPHIYGSPVHPHLHGNPLQGPNPSQGPIIHPTYDSSLQIQPSNTQQINTAFQAPLLPPNTRPFYANLDSQESSGGNSSSGTDDDSDNEQMDSGGSNPIPWSQTQSVESTQSVQSNMALMQLSGTPLPSQTVSSQQTNSLPTSKGGSKKPKLQWTGAMEKSALKLYVKATEEGLRSDGGFKAQTH
jgi:hypothetical protein